MKDIGVVIEVSEGFAYVLVNASSCRGGCASCKGCKSAVRAENLVGANVGDRVVVERNSMAVVFWSFAIFILPLLLYIAVFLVSKSHGISVVFDVLYVLILVFVSGRVSFDGKITEICDACKSVQ